MQYTHYTGNPDEDVFIHANKHCSLLGELWGDMTENTAYELAQNDSVMEPCPVCGNL